MEPSPPCCQLARVQQLSRGIPAKSVSLAIRLGLAFGGESPLNEIRNETLAGVQYIQGSGSMSLEHYICALER